MRSGFALSRALSVARKEVRHILRDPFTLAASLGLPAVLVVFFGFVMDFDVRDVGLFVHDSDLSRPSRELAEVFEASKYFRLTREPPVVDPVRELNSGEAKAVLMIPPRFGRDVLKGDGAAQLLLDGADNSTAGVILQYLAGVAAAAGARWGPSPAPMPTVRSRFLFNPELASRWFVVPGLAAVIIGLLAVLMTALTVAREWERGSMELLLSTPVRPLEIIFGKLAPYSVLGMGAVGLVYATARLVFHIPFKGSLLLFFAVSFLFLATCLAQGLLISVATRQQPLAMQISFITGLLPSLLLSGFIFPIESMSLPFRILTSVLPVRWFMVVARGIFLKGAGAADLARPLGVLALMGFLFITLAVKRFKTDLEP
jgi:ABC-2 type transport system permease protein